MAFYKRVGLNDEAFDASWQAATVSFDPLSDLVVVFENGKWSTEASSLDGLPAGVRVRSIMDCADARLGTLADSESGFVLSNTAQFTDGIFIDIDAGVVLEQPILVVHLRMEVVRSRIAIVARRMRM